MAVSLDVALFADDGGRAAEAVGALSTVFVEDPLENAVSPYLAFDVAKATSLFLVCFEVTVVIVERAFLAPLVAEATSLALFLVGGALAACVEVRALPRDAAL